MSRIQRDELTLSLIDHGSFPRAVDAEMAAQDKHWGPAVFAPHTYTDWMVILGREYGEALEAAGHIHWDGFTDAHLAALRLELIQIAAVAQQIAGVVDGHRAAMFSEALKAGNTP